MLNHFVWRVLAFGTNVWGRGRRGGQNLEGGGSDLQVSFPDVLNEIKARVNYRKNLPKGTEYTIEKGSIARGEGRKLTRRPPQFTF